MNHPRAGLRYVDAGELDDTTIDFDGMDVESQAGDKLGDIDGVIIDVNSARLYHVVVNAGGWFSSKYFLLPVGHLHLNSENKKLVADISKDQVQRYPGFDRDEFDKLTDADLGNLDRQMMASCCPDEPAVDKDFARRYETWKHYQAATWWDSSFYRPDRFDRNAETLAAMAPVGTTLPSRDEVRAERDRELVTARSTDDSTVGDVSPHFAGRAQPGDVLGVETGGEQTHIGETSEDENKRRREAEKSAATNRD